MRPPIPKISCICHTEEEHGERVTKITAGSNVCIIKLSCFALVQGETDTRPGSVERIARVWLSLSLPRWTGRCGTQENLNVIDQ